MQTKKPSELKAGDKLLNGRTVKRCRPVKWQDSAEYDERLNIQDYYYVEFEDGSEIVPDIANIMMAEE